MRKIIVFLLRLYQRWISPLFSPHCRFYPTCSEYSAQTIEKHGLMSGLYFSVRRLLKCHPWHTGGYDPVP